MSVPSPGCARPLAERSWLTRYGTTKRLVEQLGGDGWQNPEDPVGVEHAIGDEGVRVKRDAIAKGLHEQEEARLAVGSGRAVGFSDQATDDAARPSQAVVLVETCARLGIPVPLPRRIYGC